MIAAAQGAPNYLAIASNAAVLVGVLYGFTKYLERRMRKFVDEQVVPPLKRHAKADKRQFRETNRLLKKIVKWQRQGDARFQEIDLRLAAIESVNGQHAMERTRE